MDYRIVNPGALIIDNSFSPPTEEQLAASVAWGVVANMRYTSEPVGRDKNLTRAQAEAGWRHGIGALANQEQTHLDSHEGYAGGLRRARSFIAVAEAIGYPRSVPAIVSVDTSWHAEALSFVRAFDFSLRSAGWEQVGTYFFGPGPAEQLTQAGFGHDVLWQAHAGSYFGTLAAAQGAARNLDAVVRRCPNRPGYEVVSNLTHLYQEYGLVRLADGPFRAGQIDENHVRRPVRVWIPSNAPHFPGTSRPNPVPVPLPPPDTQEDAVLRLIRFTGRDAVFLAPVYQAGLLDTVRWISPALYAGYLPHVGEPIEITAEAIANLTCIGPCPPGDWPFFRVVDTAAGGQGPQGERGPAGPAGATTDEVLAALKARLP